MIIVDTALAKRQAENNPVRVAMVGAGFMARGIALQISRYTPGMELVAISNRRIEKARQAYIEAGIEKVEEVTDVAALEANIRNGKYSIANDPFLLCDAAGIDAIIEVTGAVEFGVQVSLRAMQNK